MWAPAGPSWLAEHQPSLPPSAYIIDSTQASVDYSPPTKWPRATTPVNARHADSLLLGTSSDSGVALNFSFNSPPIVNKVDHTRMSPGLRTPTSRPGIHISSTPSPFRSFRMSFSSPTLSDRALRLSNTENVIGFRYRGGSIEKPTCMTELTPSRLSCGQSGPVNVSRCLQMPSTSDEEYLDRTMPMIMGDIFDAQGVDASMTDDSGLFGFDVQLHATSTPLQQSPQNFLVQTASVPPVYNPYAELSGEPVVHPVSPVRVVTNSSPPTPSSFKRAMRDVQRQGILQPRKLLADNFNVLLPTAEASVQITDPKSQDQVLPSSESNEPVKRKIENTVSSVFEIPKKPLKPFSRRWMRIVTGGTRHQREMTAAAHAFISRLPRI